MKRSKAKRRAVKFQPWPEWRLVCPASGLVIYFAGPTRSRAELEANHSTLVANGYVPTRGTWLPDAPSKSPKAKGAARGK